MLADSSTAGIVQNSQDTMLGCYKTLLHSPSYSYNVKKEANEVSKVGIQQHKYQIATTFFCHREISTKCMDRKCNQFW